MRVHLPFYLAVITGALLCPASLAGDVDYQRDIKPVLKARCYACHGALKQEANLRLDTVAAMHKGSDSGDVIDPAGSILLDRITAAEGERMPPEGEPLTSDEIAALKAWLEGGAKAPEDEQPELDPRQHWAYQLPEPAGSDIDSLITARLADKGFKPQAEAPPEIWLRRVYFDLVGLPPTTAELNAFLISLSPSLPPSISPSGEEGETERRRDREYEAVVDRLLASPAYGERWGRHFMDIWRYSDWYGLGAELRNSQKHIWHWRDWIVESLNADKPYERMIVEMLAADEAFPTDRDALRATGFLARNYYIFNRDTWLDDVIEHTSRAFLGLTMQCAKCHDHKYDPIEQADYYRMRAIFEPHHLRLDPVPGESDFEKDGLPRSFDLHIDQPTYLFIRGDDKNPDKSQPIEPGVPSVLGGDFSIQPVALPVAAYAPGVTEENRKTFEQAAIGSVTAARMALAKAPPREQPLALKKLAVAEADLASLRARAAADVARLLDQQPSEELDRAAAHAERQATVLQAELAVIAAETASEKRQSEKAAKPAAITQAKQAVTAAKKELDAARHALEDPDCNYRHVEGSKIALVKWVAGDPAKVKAEAELGEIFPETSTGRRLALARWIANEKNPLTARVIVNHVWTRHFGASLVPDVSDFGLRSPPPLHQDVLDTLAVDFVASGWSFKRLHKQLVLSRLYRTSSSNAQAHPATLAADPDNAYFWRMNPRRLESQAIRDALLAIAGQLDLATGGPSIDPADAKSKRRSLYFVQTTQTEDRFLGAFDNASVLECYRRQESIAPQQALALANSQLSRDCAASLAARLKDLDNAALIQESFLAVLSRAPTCAELQACTDALAKLSAVSSDKPDPHRARVLFLQALLNHNDFVTLR